MEKLVQIIVSVLIGLIIGAFIGIEIYVWVNYAKTPVAELPSWVVFFMFGGRK